MPTRISDIPFIPTGTAPAPTANGSPRKWCNQCDPPRPVTIKNFAAHSARMHATVGKRAFKKKAPARKVAAKRVAAAEKASKAIARRLTEVPAGTGGYRELPGFRVLRGADGSLWLAERLR